MDRSGKDRNPYLLFFGITGLICVAAYVNILSPDSPAAIAGLLAILLASLFILSLYILRKLHLAAIIAVGTTLWLLLRLFGLRHPLYAILLLASMGAAHYLWKES